ncbi:hypothetical protein N9W43_07000 [Litoricolaceae bacterium]|nr:hypothetical protein [Litorivicinaceae bacterium]
MNNRLTALIVAFILVVGSSAYAGFRSSSQGSGTYTPPAGVTPNPLGDTDGDGTPDGTDTDDDNDGTLDVADAFPLDATESLDTDFDGIGDNADTDDDGDTIPDGDDAFPLDATQSIAALADSDVTTSCTENTCTVSGPFPSGATTITVTGTHASAPDQTATDTSGGTFSVTFNNLQAGTWAFAVTASNTGTTHLVSASSSGSSTSLADAIVNAISDPSDPVTASDLTASSLPSAVVSDLTTNSNCGTSGTENCLTWFNSLTASTACTSLAATSTNSEIETYVNCVMREGHASVATAYATSNPPSALSTTSQNACQTTITGPSPAHCAHPQWSCEVVGTSTPSGWTINSSDVGELSGVSLGGTPTNANYTVRASLNIYTPAYTYDYTFSNVRIPAGTETTVVAYHTQSSGSVVGTWNTCINNGGRMATESEVLSQIGWSTSASGGYTGSIFSLYSPGGNYSPYSNPVVAVSGYNRTNWGSCSGSWSSSDSPITKRNGRVSLRSTSGTKLKYEDSNGDVVSSSCAGSSSGTYNFWCVQPNYTCN